MGWLDRLLGNEETRRVLVIDGKRLSPISYGNTAVITAADTSLNTIKCMISLGKNQDSNDNIYSRMSELPRIAQVQIIALDSAIFLVAAMHLPKIPVDVLFEIKNGIAESLVNSKLGSEFGNTVRKVSDIYGKILLDEMQNQMDDTGLNLESGPLAKAVFEFIKDGYATADYFKERQPLEIPSLDEFQIQMFIKTSSVAALKSLANMNLHFIP